MSFFRDRGLGLAAVVLIMFAISLAQGGISYTIAYGPLRNLLPRDPTLLATILLVFRFGFLAVLIVLWTFKRKQALVRVMIAVNAVFTFALLVHTTVLIGVLLGSTSEASRALIIDVVLMSVSNVLIFSIWYWIIDPPGVEGIPLANERWDFLFPQRSNSLPNYQAWVPGYGDYVFVAFTTSLAFSPTDTMPLTLRAKMLTLLQAVISVVTLTGIAGSAINLLGGGK